MSQATGAGASPNLSAAMGPTNSALAQIESHLRNISTQFATFIQGQTPGGSGAGGSGGGPGGSGGGAPGRNSGANPNAGQTTASSLATAGGSGGGGGGGIGGALYDKGRSIGVIGWGLKGMEEAVSQRDKNMTYQSIEGGSNAAGFGERAREEAYRWSTMGMFSDSESRQAFKGVTSLGYSNQAASGPGRKEALNFLYKGKSSYGQDVNEGLQALQLATRSANIDFQTLSTTLKDVSDSAGKAGVNAKMARDQMLSAMATAVSSGYGAGSVVGAGIATNAATSLGRAYAANTNISGQFSRNQNYLVASASGMSYNKFLQTQIQDPTRAAVLRDKQSYTTASQFFGANIMAQIQQYADEMGGAEALISDPGSIDALFSQILPSLPNADAMISVFSSLSGISFSTPQDAFKWGVQQVLHQGEGKQAAQTEASSARFDPKTGKILEGKFAGQTTTTSSLNEAALAPHSRDSLIGRQQDMFQGLGRNRAVKGILGDTVAAGLNWLGGGESKSRTGKAYDNFRKGGKSDPVIEALLSNLLAAGIDPDKVNVAVGAEVYSLSQAIEKFPDLISQGNVEFLDQGLEGKKVSDVAGKRNSSVSESTAKGLRSKYGANSSQGGKDRKTFDAEKRKNEGGDAGSKATVTIAPEAQWLLALKPDTVYTPTDSAQPRS